MEFLDIAAYRFVPLDELAQLRAALKSRAAELGLRGTILLATEGINLFLAGTTTNVEAFVDDLAADARFAGIEIKRSWSAQQPFSRLLVKVIRYFEQCGSAQFRGLCFVFDARVALDAELHEHPQARDQVAA